MNKLTIKALLISLFISSLILSVSAQTTPVWAEEITQMKATVVKVSGDVRIRSRGSLFSHDAKANEVLKAGDQIETKENGKIEIKLDNDNVIDLKPKTKLILQKLTTNLKTGEFENLFESKGGSIRAKVEKLKGNSKFEVKTPNAVAAVRGTIMYLIVYPDSTMSFFQEGVGFITNPFSGKSFDVNPGNIYKIDDKGNVTGPVVPTPEQLQEIIEGWGVGAGAEGYSEPGDGENLGDGTDHQGDPDRDVRDDRRLNLTSGTGSSGSTSGSFSGTGSGTGTDNDSDGDGILNVEDAFPNSDPIENPLDFGSTDPNVYGSRDSIRHTIAKTGPAPVGFLDFGTYKQKDEDEGKDGGKVSGGIYDRISKLEGTSYPATDNVAIDNLLRDELRNDISEMLRDQEIRQLDSVMERITDAQTGKVLTDAYGYRVRVEQYVLRPDSKTVEVLNVSLRTQEAGSLAGLSTLDWKTEFNKSLDALDSGQIRDLPWNNYLDSYGDKINSPETSGNVYPSIMSIELRKSGDYLRENTDFSSRHKDHGDWIQDIDSKTLSFDLTGIGAKTRLDIKNRVTNSDPSSGHPVSIRPLNEAAAPDGFRYDVYFGHNNIKSIYVSFNVISDSGTNVSSGYDSKHFYTLGDALRANLVSGDSRNIGENNLELTVSSKRRTDPNFAGSRLIDVIYTPLPRLTWSDIDWNKH